METEWLVKRATLRMVLREHPEWTEPELANFLQMSVGWIKKWKKRLQEADPSDLSVLHARSSARKTPFPLPDPRLVQRLEQYRLSPPANLKRTPGPRTLCYYLQHDPELQAQGVSIPRSPRTIWKLLRQQGLILPQEERKHRPAPSRPPLEEIQLDFKDVTTVQGSPDGKRTHVVEACNFVDAGTSILLKVEVRDDFRAETAFDTVVGFLREMGLPRLLTFDRDSRFVGSQSKRDFPSALCRLLLCLGIQPNVCPPRRPDKNAYVERYHRSYKYECLLVDRPTTLAEAITVTAAYQQHYNWERPHQGRACRNVPPRLAWPTLPSLPSLPVEVDPDRWLQALHGRGYVRHVKADGYVSVDDREYYIGQAHRGKIVALLVDANLRQFEVWEGKTLLKRLAIKGVAGTPMELESFLTWMREQAISEEQRARLRAQTRGRAWRQQSLWEAP